MAATDFIADGDVTDLVVATNGRVVYRADQDFDDEYELYAVLTDDLFADGFESGDLFEWTPP